MHQTGVVAADPVAAFDIHRSAIGTTGQLGHVQKLTASADAALRDGNAVRGCLGRDIDHVGLALAVKMGKW